MDRRLTSVSTVVSRGLKVKFERHWCSITKNGPHELRCLFRVENASQENAKQDLELWHARLGHILMSNLKRVTKCVDKIYLNANQDDDHQMYKGCINVKYMGNHSPKSMECEIKTAGVLEIIHSDVMGPIQTKSHGGAKYVVTFVDDYYRYTAAYFIASKSEVFDNFMKYKALMENQLNQRIECIRTDTGENKSTRSSQVFVDMPGLYIEQVCRTHLSRTVWLSERTSH